MVTLRLIFVCFCVLIVTTSADFTVGMRLMRKMYEKCQKSQEIVKCFKIQAAKLADRASKMENLPILEGVTLVKRPELGRAFSSSLPEGDLNSLSSEQVDKLLEITTSQLLQTHKLNIVHSNVGSDLSRSFGEARGKMKKYIGPIITGLAIKGGFVAMAFQAIALLAGKALLIGKIALLLSVIIGLKKLVAGGEAHEKTTYEIVKHPQVSQSHTYSSSHFGNDFDTTGPSGHYKRSVEEEAAAQDRAYRAYAKKQ